MKKRTGCSRAVAGHSAEGLAELRVNLEQAGRENVQRQELPQKPLRSAGPERQGLPCAPIRGEARIRRGRAKGRIIGDRHQQHDRRHQRHADPQQAIAEKAPAAFARERRPDEQAGEKVHQRHETDVLPRAEQVEGQETPAVDDGKGLPFVGRLVEGEGSGGKEVQIGEHGVERQHDQDHQRPQIADCQA
jgi:hypothetical protein